MEKIWIRKFVSLEEAENFDVNYYMQLSSKERLDTMQYLREMHYKLIRGKNAGRKRLRRSVKVIQQV